MIVVGILSNLHEPDAMPSRQLSIAPDVTALVLAPAKAMRNTASPAADPNSTPANIRFTGNSCGFAHRGVCRREWRKCGLCSIRRRPTRAPTSPDRAGHRLFGDIDRRQAGPLADAPHGVHWNPDGSSIASTGHSTAYMRMMAAEV